MESWRIFILGRRGILRLTKFGLGKYEVRMLDSSFPLSALNPISTFIRTVFYKTKIQIHERNLLALLCVNFRVSLMYSHDIAYSVQFGKAKFDYRNKKEHTPFSNQATKLKNKNKTNEQPLIVMFVNGIWSFVYTPQWDVWINHDSIVSTHTFLKKVLFSLNGFSLTQCFLKYLVNAIERNKNAILLPIIWGWNLT